MSRAYPVGANAGDENARITLPPALRDYAERQVRAGVHADLSEVVQAGLRLLMEEEAFRLPRRDCAVAAAQPTESAGLRALLLRS